MKRVVSALLIATSLPTVDLCAGENQPHQRTFPDAHILAPKPISLARLKYNGGGDWYSSRTALSNLAKFANQQLLTQFSLIESVVDVGSADIYRYPFIFMTGHGNVVFSETDAANLRTYLISGGFLHICDNFGMDPFIKREMKKVFPELSFQVVPFSHPIYKGAFQFPNGLPKIHEHEGKPPIGYGLFWEGKLVCFYDYECDLGNGWEDPEVYRDPEAVRQQALRMGANLIQYAFTQK
ncbi:MAG: DUF4159 domain-containing protein [Sphingomonadales bacterium]|nr:DUF4159 domain-containing protein [Sphingomonadales bacterium]